MKINKNVCIRSMILVKSKPIKQLRKKNVKKKPGSRSKIQVKSEAIELLRKSKNVK